jgi:hypothetical protein
MKLAGLLLLLALLAGCEEAQSKRPRYTAVGWVRATQLTNVGNFVTFEGENHEMFTVTFSEYAPPPAIWPGMHCELVYDMNGGWRAELVSIKRLP